MKYIILILLGVTIGYCSTSYYLTKRESVKTIDTVVCHKCEYRGEDPDTGENVLVVVEECDTIYEK